MSKRKGRSKEKTTPKLDDRFEVRLSKADHHYLTKKARKAGLTKSEFVRRAVRGLEVKEGPTADGQRLIQELNRIGNNLNQIARVANAQKLVDVPQLRKTNDEIQDALNLITQAYALEG